MAASFIYQPHVHSGGIVVTPDLLIDTVVVLRGVDGVASRASIDRLSSSVEVQAAGAPLVPELAYVLIAAGFGTLFAPGLGLAEERGHGGRLLIARAAWRLADLADGFGGLTFRMTNDGTVVQEGAGASFPTPDVATGAVGGLARGAAVFCFGPAAARTISGGASVAVAIEDPRRGRSLSQVYTLRP